jgi:hypothetical protein
MLATFDRAHRRVTAWRPAGLLTALSRALLALAFVPSGLTKVLGHRFTTLSAETPIGSFFESFFQADGYYRFVGISQILAAALLLHPATATLGALLYLPIVVNVFAITLALDFGLTAAITGAMLLANLYLLCWDYDRWRGVLPGGAELGPGAARGVKAEPLAVVTLALAGAAALGLFGVTRLAIAPLPGWRHEFPLPLVLVGAGAALGVFAVWRQIAVR